MTKTLPVDIVLEREVYYDNRKARLQEFRECLADKNNQFAVLAAVKAILGQEEFISHIVKHGHRIARVKDEEKMLAIMVDEANRVLGDKYGKARERVLSDRSEK